MKSFGKALAASGRACRSSSITERATDSAERLSCSLNGLSFAAWQAGLEAVTDFDRNYSRVLPGDDFRSRACSDFRSDRTFSRDKLTNKRLYG
jgi:hypothetical protein